MGYSEKKLFLGHVLICAQIFFIIQLVTAEVSDSDLFPYDTPTDRTFAFGDDAFRNYSFTEPFTFNFFNNTYKEVFISGNGQVSFGQGITSYTANCSPGNIPMIMAYWSDAIDGDGGRLFFRESVERTLLNRATRDVHQAFPEMRGISLNWMFIVTWKNLRFFGSSSDKCKSIGTSKRNTFQLVLTTDGIHSFSLLYYSKIQWVSGTASDGNCEGLGGKAAKAGFDYGDGQTLYTVHNSCEPDIINITQSSNINQPGKWVFRIDSNLRTAECKEFGDHDTKQKLKLTPAVVSYLGNVPLKLEGPCIPKTAKVSCVYHDLENLTAEIYTEVDGAVIFGDDNSNSTAAVCPMPYFHHLGRTKVDLMLIPDVSSQETFQIYSGYLYVLNDRIVGDHLEFSLNHSDLSIDVNWDPGFFETELDYLENMSTDKKQTRIRRRRKRSLEQEKMDLHLERHDGKSFKDFGILKGGIDNNGRFNGKLNEKLMEKLLKLENLDSMMVTLKRSAEREKRQTGKISRKNKDGVWSKMGSSLMESTTKVFDFVSNHTLDLPTKFLNVSKVAIRHFLDIPGHLRNSSDYLRIRFPGQGHKYCQEWAKHEPVPDANAVRPCPDTKSRADEDDNFEPDMNSDLEYYHPGAKWSFRQRVPQKDGAGSQCNYGSEGFLIRAPPGAGTYDRYSPNADIPLHVKHDVIPYLACCKYSGEHNDQNCVDIYFKFRPLDDGSRYVLSRPTRAVGDPHLVTFDGRMYTFNGVGEFWMVRMSRGETSKESFKMQARMEQYVSPSGEKMNASVFTSIAMEEVREAEKVTIQVSHSGDKIIVLLDGKMIDAEIPGELVLSHKTASVVILQGSKEVIVTFSSGFSFHISLIGVNDAGLNIMGSASTDRITNFTEGLMGNLDGDRENDFRRPDGITLPPNSSSQEIHYNFGLPWMIQEDESIFTYLPGKSYRDYAKPDFQPKFLEPEELAGLPQNILDICSGSMECIFDYVTTGSETFAIGTKLMNEEFEAKMVVLSKPIDKALPKMCSIADIPQAENAEVFGFASSTLVSVWTIVDFKCKEGFYPPRPLFCVCLDDIRLEGPKWICGKYNRICTPIPIKSMEVPNSQCRAPPTPLNGVILGSNYSLGATVEIQCESEEFAIYWRNCHYNGRNGICKEFCNVTYTCEMEKVRNENSGIWEMKPVWTGFAGDISRVRCHSKFTEGTAKMARAASLFFQLSTAWRYVPSYAKTKKYLTGC